MPPYTGPWDGSIVVHELPSPREEVAWAAGEIRALVRQGRVRYRDIVVTARSMDPYWEQLEGVFAQYDIPLFQADKTDLLQKPLFTLITAALDAVNGGYLYEDMFRYLKTGLAGLSLPECDQLENYVLTWDIWGSRWTGAGGWTRHPGGYHQRFYAPGRGDAGDPQCPPPAGDPSLWNGCGRTPAAPSENRCSPSTSFWRRFMPRSIWRREARRCCTRVSRSWPGNTANCGRFFAGPWSSARRCWGRWRQSLPIFPGCCASFCPNTRWGPFPPPWTG